ncbi:hypothetical protein LMG28727_07368 [Paraburkholderia kirstenboschensis]|uniref:hypothetical protein n=1 Tax=Paraburkholderia kirstenboschensis TaxID=1245436 RepID=UPI000A3DD2B2|nr:hypothetical protein [Paraburkholderia kirstenboschensis]CAD6561234.1 hypothetical protein LMG28727_07368 [Paraburkholderia kirstenboschensis]
MIVWYAQWWLSSAPRLATTLDRSGRTVSRPEPIGATSAQRVLTCLFAVLCALASRATAAEPSSLCWRDFPIAATAMHYELALATGPIVPDSVLIRGKLIRLGAAESRIADTLGQGATVVEDWQPRDVQQQCEYLLELLRLHPDSMHLYKLGELKMRKMSGWFRVLEWRLDRIGTLRAYTYRPAGARLDATYLYQFTLLSAAPGEIRRKPGGAYIMIKPRPPRIEWNIDTNRLSIGLSEDQSLYRNSSDARLNSSISGR